MSSEGESIVPKRGSGGGQNKLLLVGLFVVGAGVVATIVMCVILLTRPQNPAAVVSNTTPHQQQGTTTAQGVTSTVSGSTGPNIQSTTAAGQAVSAFSGTLSDTKHTWPTSAADILKLQMAYQTNLTSFLNSSYPGASATNVTISQPSSLFAVLAASNSILVAYVAQIPSTTPVTASAVTNSITVGSSIAGLTWNVQKVQQISGPTIAPSTTSTTVLTTHTTTTNTPPPPINWSPGFLDAAEMLRSGIDPTVDPCQDFYQHTCGKWNANHPPTPQMSSVSTFGNLRASVLQNISDVLMNTPAAIQAQWPKAVQTAALIHKTCVLSHIIQPPGYSNGQTILQGIDTVTNHGGWPIINQNYTLDFTVVEALMAQLTQHGIQNLVTAYVDADWANPTKYSLYLDQATLSMDRKFFIDPLFSDIRASYLNLLVAVATQLANDSHALGVGNVTPQSIQADANAMLNYEMAVARKMTPKTERRVFSAQFNTFNLSSIERRWPFISWKNYFQTLLTVGRVDYLTQIANNSQGIVALQPGYLDELHGDILIGGTSGQRTVVNYLVWRWVYANLQFLPGPYRAHYEQFQKTLNDLRAMPPATLQCASMLVQSMPFATGYVYVHNFYNNQISSDIQAMSAGVLNSFGKMLQQVTWMDQTSQNNAIFKKNSIYQNIGTPQWLVNSTAAAALDSYDHLYISLILNNGAIQNNLLMQMWYMNLAFSNNQFKLLGQTVNRNLWLASPATVDAWYQPSLNSITFPAAFLNPPFYRIDFPQAVKYGGIGVVIGHEISHGFDDEGSQFDANGHLNNIYTPSSNAGFEKMAACVISGYNQFCYPKAEMNMCINGKNTQGENIADNAGLLAAYNAYQSHISYYGPEKRLPGLENYTPNQVFFLSFAHLFCESATPMRIIQNLVSNAHSPGRYRAIGSVMNSDIFGVAFNCPRGNSAMLPPAKQQCPVYRPMPMSPPMPTSTPAPVTQGPSNAPGWTQASQHILNGLDTTVNPCQDFYSYSCNNWIKSNPLKPHQSKVSTFGLSQKRIYDTLMNQLHNLDLNNNPQTLIAAWNFYESCINGNSNNVAYGTSVYTAFKADVMRNGWPIITNNFTMPEGHIRWNAIGVLESYYGVNAFFNTYVDVDWKHVQRNALYIDQGSLGLGSIQFYTDDRFATVRQQYLQTIISVATTLATENGVTANSAQINTDAQAILAFETRLANAMVKPASQQNYQTMFNEYNSTKLMTQFASVDWLTYFGQLLGMHIDLTKLEDRFVVTLPGYVAALSGILSNVDNRTLYNYLGWRYFYDNLMFVGPNYRQAYLELLKVRDGVSALPPTGETCIGLLMGYMPFGVGRMYVQNYANVPAIRTDIAFQTRRVVHSFQQMVNRVPWMDDNSKRLANRKAAGLIQNDVYPDWLMDDQQLDAYHHTYNVLLVSPAGAKFWQNYRWIRYGRYNENFRQLTMPASRLNFLESPALVNAWYQPERNSITFPLGILQPPFYQLNFPQAFNYGGQGAVAGHELSHAFDNNGVQFYSNGTLFTWMSPQAQAGFHNMTGCVINQYSSYCYGPPINHCIDGTVTQGENIADIAGIRAAYYAYQDYVAYKGPEPSLPNLTNYTMNQIFFLAYAHSWCTNQNDQSLLNQLVLDVHSPSKWRVNGVLADMPEFAQAFNCPVGSVEASNKCTVW